MPTPIIQRLAAVRRSLEAIGQKNGTLAPDWTPPKEAKRSNEQTAALHEQHLAVYQYALASMGESYFKKLREVSKTYLDRLGLLNSIASIKPGSPETILWANEHMQLQCKINRPSSKIDATLLISELRKAGVSHDTIEKCVAKAQVETKAPTVLTVVPVS